MDSLYWEDNANGVGGHERDFWKDLNEQERIRYTELDAKQNQLRQEIAYQAMQAEEWLPPGLLAYLQAELELSVKGWRYYRQCAIAGFGNSQAT
jgi:hypothetical protein